jgi:phosphohistidine phosphatase
MKFLTLLRHAKTERDSKSGRDFDRTLMERGQRDAGLMGMEMRRLGLEFDLVLSSPAARAVETAKFAGLNPQFDERIYDAATGELLDIVRSAGDSVGRLAMIGHNPGFERLASLMVGEDLAMPTGALVEIALPIDSWGEAGDEPGTLVRFLEPKELDQD